MKSLIFAALAAVSIRAAHAGVVELTVTPESPLVMLSDLTLPNTVIKRPWIQSSFRVTNNSDTEITLIGILMDVDSDVDLSRSYNFAFKPLVIAPGGSMDLGSHYAEELPASQGVVYNVDAQLSGWLGGLDQMRERLDVHHTFKTH